eukprot:scaffold17325_cov109-Skeletonema_dohrnii-CCMP3373.AAC.10
MLEPCKRCFYTTMANYNGSLQAMDCNNNSVSYEMLLESSTGGRLRWPHQVTYAVVATPIRPTNA